MVDWVSRLLNEHAPLVNEPNSKWHHWAKLQSTPTLHRVSGDLTRGGLLPKISLVGSLAHWILFTFCVVIFEKTSYYHPVALFKRFEISFSFPTIFGKRHFPPLSRTLRWEMVGVSTIWGTIQNRLKKQKSGDCWGWVYDRGLLCLVPLPEWTMQWIPGAFDSV